jgi:hypothetical protein
MEDQRRFPMPSNDAAICPRIWSDEEIRAIDDETKATWGRSHAVFLLILQSINPASGAEIGVAFGRNAESILSNTSVEQLYLIDPYRYRPGYDDITNVSQDTFERLLAYARARTARFGDRAQFIRSFSSELAASWNKPPLDFVFIDADHSYDAVRADVLGWLPHVRDGGIVAGHDYGYPETPDVAKAVHSVFDPMQWPVHDAGETVWYVEKRRDKDWVRAPCV